MTTDREAAEPFLMEQIKKLEEENKALREDAERYRWLRENTLFLAGAQYYSRLLGKHFDGVYGTLDAAIDAARRKP